jgi:EREBP-like factor
MCGGAILAELIPPTRRVAPKPVTEGHLWPASSKKAGSGSNKRHHHEYADDDDFEAAFEEFDDDFDVHEDDEDHPDHFVFSSKSAFSPGN